MNNSPTSPTKSKTSVTSHGCSSDEIVRYLQQAINDLYLPDADGNYKAENIEDARDILFGTQRKVYKYLKHLVHVNVDETDAISALAEIDHKLTLPDPDFKFEYNVPNIGRSDVPYTLMLRYGDESLGFVRMTVNDLSQ